MSSASRRASQMLVLACALWGLSFPVVKALNLLQQQAVPGADTWFLSGVTMVVRFAIAALLTLLLLRGRARCTKPELYQGLGLGFFGGMGMLLQVDGMSYTSASTSAFLTQGSVIFIPLTKALLHRVFPSGRAVWCILLAMLGVGVLAQVAYHTLRMGRGELETLIAALFFTGHILWLERPCYAGNNALRVSLVMFATVTLLCLPMIVHQPMAAVQSLQPPGVWLCLALLVGPCTLGSFLMMNHWQPFVSATAAGLIYCLEPVFASVLALIMPAWLAATTGASYANESVTWPMLIGGGMILLANGLMQWPPVREDEASRANEHGI